MSSGQLTRAHDSTGSAGKESTCNVGIKHFQNVYPIGNLEEWGAVVAEMKLKWRRGRMSEKTQQEQVIALWGFLGCEKLLLRLRK